MSEKQVQNHLRQYNRLFKEYDDLYRGLARHFGLSDCALWVLYFVREENHPLTQSEICERMLQPRQTIHSAFKKLEAEGILELREMDGNRKSKEIFLTEKGENLAARTADPVLNTELLAMSHLSRQEQKTFLSLFEKYVRHLNNEFEHMREQTGGEG